MSECVKSATALKTVWDQLTEEERDVYENAGYHRQFGLMSNPALVVIDVEYNFTGDVEEPILDSLKKYSNSCGAAAWRSIPFIRQLLDTARAAQIPVVYTHGLEEANDSGTPRPGTQIVDELIPKPGEHVVAKTAASAFHGTDVAAFLRDKGVDTILHTGGVTSGCVRASVVDAAAEGFCNAVVEEAVFDRAVLPHQVSLFDMDAKYADVISLADAQNYLDQVCGAQSSLPCGPQRLSSSQAYRRKETR